MSAMRLADRRLIHVTGADAESFLQGLITTDLGQLGPDEVRAGALLTPQGKILFDFLVSRRPDGLTIEIAAGQAEALLKRLTMYRLRAAVTLGAEPDPMVAVGFDAGTGGLRDIRFEKAGLQLFRHYAGNSSDHSSQDGAADYDEARLTAGIAECGPDYPPQDAFPHDVLLDLNGGLSFRKGCYVGQEVVSRMQHRGTARRRLVLVTAETALPESGAPVLSAGRPIGALGSVRGARGLAIVRIDKVGDALAHGLLLTAGEVPVTLALPAWTGLSFPEEPAEEAHQL
ncbi:aminomethyltransferase [Rhizobium rhizosphaerae]|uniref:Aminomethyltransferase n=1 Tax=Xaviernesmea rhizosphaerae TaxID=1672749 RepID=A0A1Q9AKZ5_9HYPH|nr:folate-binding protein YgfZ [Xaviernesmea rhizosphaerae]OLP55960.1 aminomethyltransferase [Xaviernesmea rhizosphaerae]